MCFLERVLPPDTLKLDALMIKPSGKRLRELMRPVKDGDISIRVVPLIDQLTDELDNVCGLLVRSSDV